MFASHLLIDRALTSVNILGNAIDQEQAEALCAILFAHPTLQTLCGLDPDAKEFDLSRRDLNCNDITLVANEMKINRALTSVNISGNKIKKEGVKAVADVLPQFR
jgi:Ran GTPase-activating protein (RanGAP) involved in mRNA processing and transport